MATIDTSSIPDFQSMTPEQQVTALLGMEIPDAVDLSGYVKKETFDAKASEAAANGKKAKELADQLKGKMSDDEKAQAETAAKQKELEDKYNALLKESTISKYKAQFLVIPGYDADLAQQAAEAMEAGEMDKFFAVQAKAQEAHEKALKAEFVKSDPRPGGNGKPNENEPDNVARARELGKQKAEAVKNSADIFGKYKI